MPPRNTVDLAVACVVDADIAGRLQGSRATNPRVRYNRTVLHALRRSYRDVQLVPASGGDARAIDVLARLRPDVVFNLAFSGHPLEPAFAGCLEMLGIPYTGSGPRGIALANDKTRSRRLLQSSGIRTARFVELRPGQSITDELAPPFFVKPVCAGGCAGVHADSLARTLDEVPRLVQRIWTRFGVPAVCDEFVVGREFRIGTIETVEDWKTVGITEWRFGSAAPGWGFKTEAIVKNRRFRRSKGVSRGLARLPRQEAAELGAIARGAVRALGVRGYATVDVRRDERARVTVLEVNANPGLWSGSSIWSNPSFQANIEQIVDAAAIVYLTRGS